MINPWNFLARKTSNTILGVNILILQLVLQHKATDQNKRHAVKCAIKKNFFFLMSIS